MPKPMTHQAGLRAATTVGAGTLAIGVALLAAPARLGPLIGLTDPRSTRLIGGLDLVLVPGLLTGRPRWPWLAARAVLNVAMAAYTLRQPHRAHADSTRARAFALALLAATVADGTAAAATRRPH